MWPEVAKTPAAAEQETAFIGTLADKPLFDDDLPEVDRATAERLGKWRGRFFWK
jgi:hypothetical protein